MKTLDSWPVLRSYDSNHLARIAMPLGGIGTGTVSLGGRGDLRDWEIMNRPAKGFVPQAASPGRSQPPFFALFMRQSGGASQVRLLEGPLDSSAYEGSSGATVPNHGWPRFRDCCFHAAYPLAQVAFSDRDVPLMVRLQAFNPLIPPDAERSGIPVAILRYVLGNPSKSLPVEASICGTIPNFIGTDGSAGAPGPAQNRNAFRQIGQLCGIFMDSAGVSRDSECWGTMSLSTTAVHGVSARTAWLHRTWGDSLLDFYDDFSADGMLNDREGSGDDPLASLAVKVEIPPGEQRSVTFLLTWHFPNRTTWTPEKDAACACRTDSPNRIGNYYTTCYADAWDVAKQTAAHLPELERETISFVHAFCASDFPDEIKEAALFNLSTLRSQTCFRTPDGFLFGWEGCCDQQGCCHGSCTHVWNYEETLPFLFANLARKMREIEFLHATDKNGMMSFRVNLPLSRARGFAHAATDGQMGCLLKLYREWRISGDTEWLRQLWPAARRALEFCWIPGGWDADRDGVMEGCQHNTMDVEYYGPNPQMSGWYLGALRAVEEMARAMGENDFAAQCRALFDHGSQWVDRHLFNGEYYEHRVQPPVQASAIAPALRVGMGATDSTLADPPLQLGAGCLIDQLIGPLTARICGLGNLLDPAHVRQTLRSLMTYNFQPDLQNHFNHLRTFALGDESAMLMATYPRGRRPNRPFPYYNEIMTGFEYCVAVHLLIEGQEKDGLKLIRAIRARYDGGRRNPFDEAECGHHYARAMAAWGAIPAWSGFDYSALSRTLRFAAREGTWFWSNGAAWGTCRIQRRKKFWTVSLRVEQGSLILHTFELASLGQRQFKTPRRLQAPTAVVWRFAVEN